MDRNGFEGIEETAQRPIEAAQERARPRPGGEGWQPLALESASAGWERPGPGPSDLRSVSSGRTVIPNRRTRLNRRSPFASLCSAIKRGERSRNPGPDRNHHPPHARPAENRRRWESSCASSATLGPRWVRVTTVEHGHGRSPTVAYGLEEPQVAGPPAQAAGLTQTRGSDCGPRRSGVRAVDRPPEQRFRAHRPFLPRTPGSASSTLVNGRPCRVPRQESALSQRWPRHKASRFQAKPESQRRSYFARKEITCHLSGQ
jgi:hypothetical protein